MNILSFQKTTLQDYPGKISSIVFTKGCNYRCGYCHNPDLISVYGKNFIDHDEIFNYLKKRKKILQGLVITGGEPTLQTDLEEFIIKVKEIGLDVKLDTNGSNPNVIERLINKKLVDYIAMDYKYPINNYYQIIKTQINPDSINQSKDIIMNSKIDYEFRVTIIEKLFNKEILEKISDEIKGAKKIQLQGFRNEVVFDKRFKSYKDTSEKFLIDAVKIFKKASKNVVYIAP
jgi:pyruvate formate lyase activating enzyme